MAEENGQSAHVEVPAPGAQSHAESPAIINVSGPLMILTWLTFIVMSYILYKVAWKPILKALDIREEHIRKAKEDADRARTELAQIEARSRQILAEAEAQRQALVTEARATAEDLMKAAERKARDDGAMIVDNARREIEGAVGQARIALRAETAELVTTLAGKLVGANMDSAKNKALVEKLADELKAEPRR